MTTRVWCSAIALSIALGFGGGNFDRLSGQDRNASGAAISPIRMADGKEWTARNLDIAVDQSYCFEGVPQNCARYGRLYTWESARRACRLLGAGWRLPTDDEWRNMAKHYGGIREDSDNAGKAAYEALLNGGSSGFNALLGGNRSPDGGDYARLGAHGFYWTSSETDSANAFFYNFGKGGQALNRQTEGNKQMAISVRCIRN